MLSFISRVGRAVGPLAPLATAFATILTLGACADDQPITAPSSQPNTPSVLAGNFATALDDSTRLTFTVPSQARVNGDGMVYVRGTVTCSRVNNQVVPLFVRVVQRQPGGKLGEGAILTSVACVSTNSQEWIGSVYAAAGHFDRGKATVSIAVNNPPSGVAQTSASTTVRLISSDGR